MAVVGMQAHMAASPWDSEGAKTNITTDRFGDRLAYDIHARPSMNIPSDRFGELVSLLCDEHIAQLELAREGASPSWSVARQPEVDESLCSSPNVVDKASDFENGGHAARAAFRRGSSREVKDSHVTIAVNEDENVDVPDTDAPCLVPNERIVVDLDEVIALSDSKAPTRSLTAMQLGPFTVAPIPALTGSKQQPSRPSLKKGLSQQWSSASNPFPVSGPQSEGPRKKSQSLSWLNLSDEDFMVRPVWLQKMSKHKTSSVIANKNGDGNSKGKELERDLEVLQASYWSGLVAHPNSKHRAAWDCLGLLFLGYDMIFIPLGFFDLPPSTLFDVFNWTILVFWTLDLIGNFFVGHYSEGVLVTAPDRVAKRYLITWFPLDICIVGLDWAFQVVELSGAGESSGSGMRSYVRALRVLRIVRVLRLLRLLKVRRLMQNIEDVMDTEKLAIYFNFLKPIGACILFNHFVACFWYKIGDIGEEPNFIDAYKLAGRSFGYKYTTCFHWALSHFTVGNMDISAVNFYERLFTVLVFITGLSMFSTLIGNVASSVEQLRELHTDVTRQFWLLRRYLKDFKISKNLTIRIHRYCDYAYKNSKTRLDDQKVPLLKLLSEQLRDELSSEIKVPDITKHPFFKTLVLMKDMAIDRICAKALQGLEVACQDVLFNPGDPCGRMYFLSDGKLTYVRQQIPEEWEDPNSCADLVDSIDAAADAAHWICEAALWTPWVHVGLLSAETEACMITLDTQLFCEHMGTAQRRTFNATKAYAVCFTKCLNDSTSKNCLTDLAHLLFEVQQVLDDAGLSSAPSAPGWQPTLSRGSSFLVSKTSQSTSDGSQSDSEAQMSASAGFSEQNSMSSEDSCVAPPDDAGPVGL